MTKFFIENKISASILILFTWILGLWLYPQFQLSEMADIETPGISIEIQYSGAAAELVESTIVLPLENTLSSVKSVKSIDATAFKGVAKFFVEFPLGTDMDSRVGEIYSAVQRAAPDLPEEAKPPFIFRANSTDPVIFWTVLVTDGKAQESEADSSLKISSDLERELELMKNLLYEIKPQLALVAGVSEIVTAGTVEPEMTVTLEPKKLQLHAISPLDVVQAIQNEHSRDSGGRVQTHNISREYSVRTFGETNDAFNLSQVPILNRSMGGVNQSYLLLTDVANVEQNIGERRNISRLNGKKAVSIGFKKQRDANLFLTVQKIKEELAKIELRNPGYQFVHTKDSSEYIKANIDNLVSTAVFCLLATMLVILLTFKSLRASLPILIMIPTCFFATLAVIYALGYSLNNFTLLALAVSFGVIIDDAIVAIHQMTDYHLNGKSLVDSALLALNSLVRPIIGTSLVLIAMFLPVGLIDSRLGQSFWQFAVVFCISIFISTIFTLLITPMLFVTFGIGKKAGQDKNKSGRLLKFNNKALRLGFRNPAKVVASFVLITALTVVLLRKHERELIPYIDLGEITIAIYERAGRSLRVMDAMTQAVEQFLEKVPGIRHTLAIVGSVNSSDVNIATIELKLENREERLKADLTQKKIAALARERFAKLRLMNTVVSEQESNGLVAGTAPIDFYIQGPDWEKLVDLAQQASDEFSKTGLFADTVLNYSADTPEIQIVPDRHKAALHKVSIRELTWTMDALMGVLDAGKITVGGGVNRQNIRVKLGDRAVDRPDQFKGLMVRNQYGNLVPLNSVAEVTENRVNQYITRLNRQRALRVSSYLNPNVSAMKSLQVADETLKSILPEGYFFTWAGRTQESLATQDKVSLAIFLGVILVLLILVVQFNSLFLPILVLLSMPSGVLGSLVFLKLFDLSLNMYSCIGLVLVLGVAIKNTLFLLEAVPKRKKATNSDPSYSIPSVFKVRSLWKTALHRSLPIQTTTFSTIVGAVPIFC